MLSLQAAINNQDYSSIKHLIDFANGIKGESKFAHYLKTHKPNIAIALSYFFMGLLNYACVGLDISGAVSTGPTIIGPIFLGLLAIMNFAIGSLCMVRAWQALTSNTLASGYSPAKNNDKNNLAASILRLTDHLQKTNDIHIAKPTYLKRVANSYRNNKTAVVISHFLLVGITADVLAAVAIIGHDFVKPGVKVLFQGACGFFGSCCGSHKLDSYKYLNLDEFTAPDLK